MPFNMEKIRAFIRPCIAQEGEILLSEDGVITCTSPKAMGFHMEILDFEKGPGNWELCRLQFTDPCSGKPVVREGRIPDEVSYASILFSCAINSALSKAWYEADMRDQEARERRMRK
jgi:hypothetical protein